MLILLLVLQMPPCPAPLASRRAHRRPQHGRQRACALHQTFPGTLRWLHAAPQRGGQRCGAHWGAARSLQARRSRSRGAVACLRGRPVCAGRRVCPSRWPVSSRGASRGDPAETRCCFRRSRRRSKQHPSCSLTVACRRVPCRRHARRGPCASGGCGAARSGQRPCRAETFPPPWGEPSCVASAARTALLHCAQNSAPTRRLGVPRAASRSVTVAAWRDARARRDRTSERLHWRPGARWHRARGPSLPKCDARVSLATILVTATCRRPRTEA